MTYHISRDYVAENTGYATNKFHTTSFYQITLFLYRILGYSIIGQTNWNISSTPFLIASGLSSNSLGASINTTYEVSIPSSVKIVNSSDIGRPLILKSNSNPIFNSGIFKISNINSINNSFIIDYRSTDPSISESSTLDWWLYEKENIISSNLNNDGYNSVGYAGGNAVNSKIILQSPHASAWQIRLCVEPFVFNSVLPNISIAIGYDGNSSGDFTTFGNHSHISQYLNINPSSGYLNTVPGFGHSGTVDRITMAGDDTGQAFFAFTRGATTGEIISFGIPNNEEIPTPAGASRVFCYAKSSVGNNSNTDTTVLRISNTNNVGATNKNGIPTLCAFAGWANIDGYALVSPTLSVNAGDCPFTGSTELLPIEVWSGITADITLLTVQPSTTIYQIDQTMMGTAPFIRLGRGNFGNFTASTDANKSWLHIKNGIYLQYNGPTPI